MLICNGEIYNWKELYNIMGIQGKSRSDCEVIVIYIKGMVLNKHYKC